MVLVVILMLVCVCLLVGDDDTDAHVLAICDGIADYGSGRRC